MRHPYWHCTSTCYHRPSCALTIRKQLLASRWAPGPEERIRYMIAAGSVIDHNGVKGGAQIGS